jgi:RNA polymerase sigma-70 factor, ECF subfamily
MAPMLPAEEEARRTAELAARNSRGRLIAFLSSRTRDIAGAEDALAEAFAQALSSWPRTGVPDNPEAWLLVAARRNMAKGWRRAKLDEAAQPELMRAVEEAEQMAEERAEQAFPDERLNLMFVCAHPYIEASAHTPLMLQTVLGLDASRIASAFCVSPAAMGQRLTRAKARIRDAAIAFRLVDGDEIAQRREAVLAAIYAAHGADWNHYQGAEDGGERLGLEAIHLARLLVANDPACAECKGLLALLLYCEARRTARRGEDGAYIPLDAQEVSLWDTDMIGEADRLLMEAGRSKSFGRWQCEAAIQAVHCERARTGRVNHDALRQLYRALNLMRPTLGGLVGEAAALLAAGNAGEALAMLEELADDPSARAYQPWWAVRAHAQAAAGRQAEAAEAFAVAAGMTEDAGLRRYLLAQVGLQGSLQS